MNLKEVLKKILPPFFPELYKWIRLNPSERAEHRAIQKIRSTPRYVAGKTTILGGDRLISFTDSASFLFIFEELFKKEIYKFQSDRDNPFIIDAGANIGLGVLYFKKLFPKARVIAFEPDPKVFEILNHNIKSMQLDNIETVNKALWYEESFLDFFSEGADAGRLATAEDKQHILSIPTTTLSSYLQAAPVDFLKIDIEGAEYEVLKESQHQLKNVKNIFIEYHSFVNQQQHLSEIIGILENSGFRVNINYVGIYSKSPMVKIEQQMGMDLQLNIYGVRD